ncbi:MAG: ROK family transcriptional regulator [Cyclobacteriaceae bacterium]|jgi:predicted NBD/HSP70 family sugar kinase|uniref:ROK family transcriptional regulator n=1 Tax=Algoriphagus marincola TaxID=264027 RepID=A0ABS7N016_9BACT|nr:ROK family transcriptional regulator [Algoriphagus marincola]MBY5949652.1 ROK family transcriptional regulator [Algoriphagus marincola]MCR9081003.1 ROK family transcriptional regulator [Cyclobacteriaceae bacterium]
MNLINPQAVIDQMDGVVEIKSYLNKIKIIKNLYLKGANTASEICTEVGISLPTVNSLLSDLMSSGEVIKQGRAESQGGRKPDLYRLAEDAFYVLSVDLSKFTINLCLYSCHNQPITEKECHKLVLNNERETFDRIADLIEAYLQKSGIPSEKIIAIGISMPGLVDAVGGVNYTYLRFGRKTLLDSFEERFQKKVFLENDARAMTLAEFKFGPDHTHKNVLGVFVGWGIGLGIIIDGKIYRGASGFAGEFSHSPIFENRNVTCSCGKKGCLEAVASGTAIVRMAEEAIKIDSDSILARIVRDHQGELEPGLVVEAALAGDQRAITILSEAGLDLGRGISILIQLLNPDLIIIGGSVAEANQYLITPIQQALNIYSMAKSREKSELALYQLGKDVGLMGGVAVVNEQLFEDVLKKLS